MYLDALSYLRSFNGQMKSSLSIVVILSIVFIILSFKIKKVDPLGKTPKWLVPLIMVVDIVNNYTKQNIGRRWKHYAAYYLTLGIFIFVSNTYSLWGCMNPTNYVIINAALAITVFFVIQTSGIISNGILGYLKGFIDPIPVMLPINLISELTFPLSLSLRLFGNILSSTVLEAIITGLVGWFAIPVLPLLNGIFDVALGFIQVMVFVMLSVIFTSMKINDEEKIYA